MIYEIQLEEEQRTGTRQSGAGFSDFERLEIKETMSFPVAHRPFG